MALLDWNLLWNNEMLLTSRKRLASGAFWDAPRDGGGRSAFSEELTRAQLGLIAPEAGERVLEIGPGAGRLTLPLARRCASVTAVEPSAGMAERLAANAREAGLSNVDIVPRHWEDLDEGIGIHDVVVASYSLFMMDMRDRLSLVNAVASDRACLFVPAELRLPPPIQRLLHGAAMTIQLPDHLILLNLLYDLGIAAELRLLGFDADKRFADRAAALEEYRRFYDAPESLAPALDEYLGGIGREDGEGFLVPRRARTGALLWRKR